MAFPFLLPLLLAGAGAGIGAIANKKNRLKGALFGGLLGGLGGIGAGQLGLGKLAAAKIAATASTPVSMGASTIANAGGLPIAEQLAMRGVFPAAKMGFGAGLKKYMTMGNLQKGMQMMGGQGQQEQTPDPLLIGGGGQQMPIASLGGGQGGMGTPIVPDPGGGAPFRPYGRPRWPDPYGGYLG